MPSTALGSQGTVSTQRLVRELPLRKSITTSGVTAQQHQLPQFAGDLVHFHLPRAHSPAPRGTKPHWGMKCKGKGEKSIQLLSGRWKIGFPPALSCLLENTLCVEGDLLSPSCPPELGATGLTHVMTDRCQREQIGLELAPEKIILQFLNEKNQISA